MRKAKKVPEFKLKNFRLSEKAQNELAKAAKRLSVPEVRIVEELINRYAGALRVDFIAE